MAHKASAGSSTTPVDHHSKVKAACEECRTRKIKRDARRPLCSSCEKKGKECLYATEPDELRITALKRRFAELSRTTLNNDALIRLLRETPLDEARNILTRIRANENILSILSSNDGSHTPESNLMLAIQNTQLDNAVDHPSTPVRSDESQPPRISAVPPNAPIGKQSIAFLMGATSDNSHTTEGGSTTPAVSTVESQVRKNQDAKKPSGWTSGTPRRSSDTRSQTLPYLHAQAGDHRDDTDKRRPSKYARPGHAIHHTWSGPALFRRKSYSKGDSLAARARSTHKSWKTGLEEVKAADWDAHYVDDETFLEILKCYFVWENPVLGIVDEKSFWRGLVEGGSEFCNVTLVHAILAFGAKIYGMFEPEMGVLPAQSALVETINLWDWDADATVPANISAGLLLHATLTSNAQDIDGAPYLAGAMNLASKSGLFTKERVSQTYPDSDLTLATQRSLFAWNVYSYYCMHTLSFSQQPALTPKPPPVDIVAIEQKVDSREWTPFPLQSPSRPCLASSTYHTRAKLWQIANKIVPIRNSHEGDTTGERRWQRWEDAIRLFEELQSWRSKLSTRQSILHGAPPHVFSLHTDYHRCVIELFRPFVAFGPDRKNFQLAHDQTHQSVLQLRSLVHQAELEFPDLPVSFHALTTSLVFVANETLSAIKDQPEQSDECFYFCLSLKQMQRMVGVYPLARYLIIGLGQMARRMGVELPPEAQEILQAVKCVMQSNIAPNSRFHLQLNLKATDLDASSLQRLFEEAQGMKM